MQAYQVMFQLYEAQGFWVRGYHWPTIGYNAEIGVWRGKNSIHILHMEGAVQ